MWCVLCAYTEITQCSHSVHTVQAQLGMAKLCVVTV